MLVAGSLFSRTLGATYRLILPILMGGGRQAAVGMGLFQFAYPIFTVLVTLITTGFPLAVSKMVSEHLAAGQPAAARRVVRVASVALPVSGLALAAALWVLAPTLARHLAGDPRAALSMRAIAPAIFTVSFASAYRGAFQGMEDMAPYAVSQVVEQIGRILTMFALVILLLPRGLGWAAAGASFGATVGGVFATATITALWLRRGRGRLGLGGVAPMAPHALGQLLRLAVPMALAATLLPLLNLADAAIVPLRLREAGLGAQAIALYGVLTGYAAPLVLAPTVFTSALAMSLLPAVSAVLASGDRAGAGRRAASGLRLAGLFALPAATGLALLAGPLPMLLFHSAAARRPLEALAPALLFLSLQQTSSGVLQALGRPDLPMRNLAVGGALKVVVAWVLVGLPAWNVTGAALSTTLAFAVACVLNLRTAAHLLPGSVDWRGMTFRPLCATALMALAVLVLVHLAGASAALAVALGVVGGAAVYGVALLALRALRREEVELLPRVGGSWAVALDRLGLIR